MANSGSALSLDPFGFMPGYASMIRPLGGTTASPDPRYAFHTPYVKFRAGRVRFTTKIAGLTAKGGELHLRVHGFIPESGRDAVLVTSSRIELSHQPDGVEHEMIVRCVGGVGYAVYAFILDANQVNADSVTVFAEEEDDGAYGYSEELDGPTSFGTERLGRPGELIGHARPVFAEPVSQCMTEAQLDEPAFAQWRTRLPASLRPEQSWAAAQALQILERYGLLHHGALGLGLGDNEQVLPPILAQHGCETECYAIDGGRVERISEDAATVVGWRIEDEPPVALRGFDFLWSFQGLDAAQGYGQAARFVECALRVLRQGGYGVFRLSMIDRPGADSAGPGILTRREVERLALTMISRSHDVAQLNFAADELDGPRATGAVTPFLLIVRRSRALI